MFIGTSQGTESDSEVSFAIHRKKKENKYKSDTKMHYRFQSPKHLQWGREREMNVLREFNEALNTREIVQEQMIEMKTGKTTGWMDLR